MSPVIVLVILQDRYFDTVLGGVHHIKFESDHGEHSLQFRACNFRLALSDSLRSPTKSAGRAVQQLSDELLET
jgi:hypothetical protein